MGYRGLTPTIPLCNDLKAIKERLIKQLFYNKKGDDKICKYGLQKDWRKWTLSPIKVTVIKKDDSGVIKKGDSKIGLKPIPERDSDVPKEKKEI